MTDALRPTTWDSYVGQEKLKERLSIHIDAARFSNRQLDHTLLIGPPGCGKTTIAAIIAKQMRMNFHSYVMPLDPSTMTKVLTQRTGVMLLDEIHRLSAKQQESLLSVVEDGYIQNKTVRMPVKNLTIIGATTEPDDIIAPLWDRFLIKPTFDDYTDEEMATIVSQMAVLSGLDMDEETCFALGRASGGVPRNARSFVAMARDLFVTQLSMPTTDEILGRMRVTEDGLTEEHQRYLRVLEDCGGVTGLDVLSTHLRLPKPILLNLERLLVKQKWITYTKQGRELIRWITTE